MALNTTSATCETCNTLFTDLPFEVDECGGYAVLEVTPCAACGVILCGCCSQFCCDGCSGTFCSTHKVVVPDGTTRPLRCCPTCAVECEPMELPLPKPPARELHYATRNGKEVA
jgi:hypothetical protein